MVRMHSMAILVESERQKEKVELRQIHKALGSVVLMLRHVSGHESTVSVRRPLAPVSKCHQI